MEVFKRNWKTKRGQPERTAIGKRKLYGTREWGSLFMHATPQMITSVWLIEKAVRLNHNREVYFDLRGIIIKLEMLIADRNDLNKKYGVLPSAKDTISNENEIP
jgi:hypothetical protein